MMHHFIKNKWFTTLVMATYLVSTVQATQVIPNPVNPQIGENLWQMNYRQSIAIDDIMDTTTLCCACDYFISQADIDANGGGFIITQPGNWCVSEPLTISRRIVIDSTPNVSLDLHGHTIRATFSNLDFIKVLSSPGTKISNGSLLAPDLGDQSANRVGVFLDSSNNVIVENIVFTCEGTVDDPLNSQTATGFFIDGGSRGALLRNCSATGTYLTGFEIQGQYHTLEGCKVVNFSGDLNSLTDIQSGVGFLIPDFASNIYLNQCTSIGGIDQPSAASAGSTGFVVQGNNTVLSNCVALSHKVQQGGVFPAPYIPGNGFTISGNNCQLTNCTSAYNQDTGILNTGSGLVVCNNTVHDNTLNDLVGVPQSSLCSLINGVSGCDYIITQADIGAGGIYTITQPGKYCLAEEIEYDTLNAIVIGIEDVVLDCRNFPMIRTTLNTNPTIDGAIVCLADRCVIKNANIFNDTIITNNSDVTITNCKLNGVIGVFPASIVVKTGANQCLIENCDIVGSNTHGINIEANAFNTIVDHCNVRQCSLNGILINGASTIVRNSIFQGNNLSGLYADALSSVLLVENCIAQFNLAQGFWFHAHPFALSQIDNCQAIGNAVFGIVLGGIGAGNLQAYYTAVGLYGMVDSYGMRVTNCIAARNLFDIYMFLTITDPLNVQPTINNTARIVSPTVGIIQGSTGSLLNDTTLGSTNVLAPLIPAPYANYIGIGA